MLLCQFQRDPVLSTLYVCTVCGTSWTDKHGHSRAPIRGCVSNVREAWQRFDILSPMPMSITRLLTEWHDAGYPERAKDFDASMAWVRANPCEHRSVGGFCRKVGCGKDKDTNVHCSCLYRMATALCPAGKFGGAPCSCS